MEILSQIFFFLQNSFFGLYILHFSQYNEFCK